jgi:hypothetical protein
VSLVNQTIETLLSFSARYLQVLLFHVRAEHSARASDKMNVKGGRRVVGILLLGELNNTPF